jgi:outer membrane protein assembly factor BamD
VIKANFQYALMSTEDKKEARFTQVITDCNDFNDRFPESKLKKQVEEYLTTSTNNIKSDKNEQVKKAG